MTKCFKCGREIKNVYKHNNKPYGKQCYSNLMEEINKTKKENGLNKWNLKSEIFIQVLKQKDLSKITNSFKLNVIPDIINQFDSEGWLSKKQMNMVINWFNNKDYINYYTLLHGSNFFSDLEYHQAMINVTSGKKLKYHKMRYDSYLNN